MTDPKKIILAEMIRFHKMGLHPHWLKPNSKNPCDDKWTTNPRKNISRLKNEYRKGFNLGLRTGEMIDDYYHIVIDVDVKSKIPRHRQEAEEALFRIFPELKNKTLFYTESGRGNGSIHIHARIKNRISSKKLAGSDDLVKVKIKTQNPPTKADQANLSEEELQEGYRMRAAWGIDLLADKRQVVIPPSVHPDTRKTYKWGRPFKSFNDLPLIKNKSFEYEDADGLSKLKAESQFELVKFDDEVDLECRGLSEKTQKLIIDGEGVEGDRSPCLMSALMAMLKCGYTKDEILSVLTNREYYLGEVAYDHANSQNRQKAAKWLYKNVYLKAMVKTHPRHIFDIPFPEDVKLSEQAAKDQLKEIVQTPNWKTTLDRAESGAIKLTSRNIERVLTFSTSHEIFKLNEFSNKRVYGAKPLWSQKHIGDTVDDNDISEIIVWFSKKFRMEVTAAKLWHVISGLANKNKFHPVRNYLLSLKWDRVSRVEKLFIEYIKSNEHPHYLKTIARKFLAAMVARILKPGIKFDSILILEGQQGIGKSTAAKILASEEWFSDADINIGDKDAILALLGNWVIELGELTAIQRASMEKYKAFFSRQIDQIRVPYGKLPEDFKRQCVFIATTNQEQYLKDSTGNRRFWPLWVSKVDLNKLSEDRDQILAEAVHIFRNGESLYLNAEESRIASYVQEKRMENDPWLEKMYEFLCREKEKKSKLYKRFEAKEMFGPSGPLSSLSEFDTGVARRVINLARRIGYSCRRVKGYNTLFLADEDKFMSYGGERK